MGKPCDELTILFGQLTLCLVYGDFASGLVIGISSRTAKGGPDGNEKYQGILLARGVPPIHFGKEDGVERTLLRVACQSETFLASPWQGDANIRFLWHIGCQSDFDELVSMACRPVDRGFCRMGILMSFHPVKGPFARTKTANHNSSSASEPPHRTRRSAF